MKAMEVFLKKLETYAASMVRGYPSEDRLSHPDGTF